MNRPLSTPSPDSEGRDLTAAAPVGEPVAEPAAPGRHRQHRFPARPHALKVLYGEDEHAMIRHAAAIAGLRVSSYVAMAALAMAEQVQSERHGERPDEPSGAAERRRHAALTPHQDRELLAELIQARLALRRYAVNVNRSPLCSTVAGTCRCGCRPRSSGPTGRSPGSTPPPEHWLAACADRCLRSPAAARARLAVSWARVVATAGKASGGADGCVGKNSGKGRWSSSVG